MQQEAAIRRRERSTPTLKSNSIWQQQQQEQEQEQQEQEV